MISRFIVDLPGQPISWNHSYDPVFLPVKDGFGQPVFNAKGDRKKHVSWKKKETAVEYQRTARLIISAARPTGFRPEGQLYILYEFFLGRWMDADNTMKMIGDTVALSLDIDDKWFLPVAVSLETKVKEPHVRLTLLDAAYWQIEASPR